MRIKKKNKKSLTKKTLQKSTELVDNHKNSANLLCFLTERISHTPLKDIGFLERKKLAPNIDANLIFINN